MSILEHDNLKVAYTDGVTRYSPIIPRCYTLTNSEEDKYLYLYIGIKFEYSKITPLRNEVLGAWSKIGTKYILKIDVDIDGQGGKSEAKVREEVFRKEIPLALETIIYGDRDLLDEHKELNVSPIVVYFNSKYIEFNKVESFGTVRDYTMNYDYSINVERKKKLEKEKLNKDEVIKTLLLPYIDRGVYYKSKKKVKYTNKDIEIDEIKEKIVDNNYNFNIKVITYNEESKKEYKITISIKASRIEIKSVEKV